MDTAGYIKRIEEIKFAQGKLEKPENRMIDEIAGIAISEEDAAIAALKHERQFSRALCEKELVMQRQGFDPAFQGGILDI